ncbi:hypothetical protein [Neisseria perflava]|uniref:hypothetical protein n=1 Tax=Neisseria perflava TaxID=33053 RepID=UPI00209D391B|nr:hypothetical protein [Neisseria perflava]MCP1659881.1 uncharacterized protein YlzI (FlbEa/FlbD family) [Neisseria perflava]MCP1772685.1 uncharacterized protein YlzI (FlbEa/FlbD family) [Neisseria perflava]
MRKNDIYEIFKEIEEGIVDLKKFNKISKVKFKSILENLRSILEYVAHDINMALSQPKDEARLYFPYGESYKKFKESTDRNLRNLDAEIPEIYCLLESLQPHKDNNNWLVLMCEFTNQVKHKKLIDIHEKDENSVILSTGGMPIFEFINCSNVIVEGERIVLEDQNGTVTDFGKMGSYHISQDKVISQENNPNMSHIIIKGKKLILENKEIELIPFVDEYFYKIKKFSDEVYMILGKLDKLM